MKPSSVEILNALRNIKDRKHVSLSTLFRPYDSNGDDKLTPSEFHRMLDDLGFELDSGSVRDLLTLIVRDAGGGLLSLRDLSLALEQTGSGACFSAKSLSNKHDPCHNKKKITSNSSIKTLMLDAHQRGQGSN